MINSNFKERYMLKGTSSKVETFKRKVVQIKTSLLLQHSFIEIASKNMTSLTTYAFLTLFWACHVCLWRSLTFLLLFVSVPIPGFQVERRVFQSRVKIDWMFQVSTYQLNCEHAHETFQG